jgi:hypothetical protein
MSPSGLLPYWPEDSELQSGRRLLADQSVRDSHGEGWVLFDCVSLCQTHSSFAYPSALLIPPDKHIDLYVTYVQKPSPADRRVAAGIHNKHTPQRFDSSSNASIIPNLPQLAPSA